MSTKSSSEKRLDEAMRSSALNSPLTVSELVEFIQSNTGHETIIKGMKFTRGSDLPEVFEVRHEFAWQPGHPVAGLELNDAPRNDWHNATPECRADAIEEDARAIAGYGGNGDHETESGRTEVRTYFSGHSQVMTPTAIMIDDRSDCAFLIVDPANCGKTRD